MSSKFKHENQNSLEFQKSDWTSSIWRCVHTLTRCGRSPAGACFSLAVQDLACEKFVLGPQGCLFCASLHCGGVALDSRFLLTVALRLTACCMDARGGLTIGGGNETEMDWVLQASSSHLAWLPDNLKCMPVKFQTWHSDKHVGPKFFSSKTSCHSSQ